MSRCPYLFVQYYIRSNREGYQANGMFSNQTSRASNSCLAVCLEILAHSAELLENLGKRIVI
jgi:hypothetical protein